MFISNSTRLLVLLGMLALSTGVCCTGSDKFDREAKKRSEAFTAHRSAFDETVSKLLSRKTIESEYMDISKELRSIGISRILVYADCVLFEFVSNAEDSRRAIFYSLPKEKRRLTLSLPTFRYSFHRKVKLDKAHWSYVLFD